MIRAALPGLAVLLLAACTPNAGADMDNGGVDESAKRIVVHKTPSCGCCEDYIGQLEARGYEVETVDTDDISGIKAEFGIPDDLWSCHTAVVDGYFIEGHMPFEAVEALLQEQPDIAGIALAGMPLGSPGMPGEKDGPFVVQAVNRDGGTFEFGTY